MANGRRLDDKKLTVASWDYPFGTKLRITNTKNNRSVVCTVTDRGPARKLYKKGRIIDLTAAAFKAIAGKQGLREGILNITLEVVYE